MAKTFSGGIHPGDFKERTRGLPIVEAPLPDRVVIPLLQHIGAPCKPLVERGAQVKTGQPIGAVQGFVSAPVHASITGKVKSIEPMPHPVSGKRLPAVIIERTGEDEWYEGVNRPRDVTSLGPDELREIIRDAGIVGMGGAAFPTHVKLTPPPEHPIDSVILNAAECEPYLTCDERLMIERAADVLAGLRLVQRILGSVKAYVGIEANKPEAYAALREAVGNDPSISIQTVEVKYPQGAEQQLIKVLLGREVPWKGGLPMQVGVVVHNIGTVLAIFEAVTCGMPLIRRVLTITGDAVGEPGNYMVRIGTPVGALLAQADVAPDASKLILGGPMMGLAQWTDEVPVLKGTSGILLLRNAASVVSRPCIRCGRCVRACPLRLLPAEISRAMEAGRVDLANEFYVTECKECGCCAYVCPSKRSIVQQVKVAKAELMRRRAEERARQNARAAQQTAAS